MEELKELNDFVAVKYLEGRANHTNNLKELTKRYESLENDAQREAFIEYWKDRNVTLKELEP